HDAGKPEAGPSEPMRERPFGVSRVHAALHTAIAAISGVFGPVSGIRFAGSVAGCPAGPGVERLARARYDRAPGPRLPWFEQQQGHRSVARFIDELKRTHDCGALRASDI